MWNFGIIIIDISAIFIVAAFVRMKLRWIHFLLTLIIKEVVYKFQQVNALFLNIEFLLYMLSTRF